MEFNVDLGFICGGIIVVWFLIDQAVGYKRRKDREKKDD